MAQTTARNIPYATPNDRDFRRLGTVLLVTAVLGIAAGIGIGRGTAGVVSSTSGVAVTDGWMHSAITRLGAAELMTSTGPAVADGWQSSPFTRLFAFDPDSGIALTDGWMHSPYTRGGSTLERISALTNGALDYQRGDPAAEARGN